MWSALSLPVYQVGAYHIGKERAYLGPARQLGYLVYCQPAKLRVRPFTLLNLVMQPFPNFCR